MNEVYQKIQRHHSTTQGAFEHIRANGIEQVCVIGLGYIGLPTAALMANRGYQIRGVDVSADAIQKINRGELHLVEPDLDVFVKAAVSSGRLTAGYEATAADVFFICVPTPFQENEGDVPTPDLSYVQDAVKKIAPFVKSGNAVILESTSPVGTTEMMARILSEEGVDIDGIHIAYCPERVLPGKIVLELIENDRIVGGVNKAAAEFVGSFYRSFVVGQVFITDSRTAEMCKLVENASRDAQIAFANELSMICDGQGINVWELIKLANHHPRVNILNPGTGVGGHCIAVDPWFIIAGSPKESRLIKMAREVNNNKPEWCVEKIKKTINEFRDREKKNPIVGLLGLAFKADIDDLRESPAVEVAEAVQKYNPQTLVCEPHISSHLHFELTNLDDIVKRSDILVVLVGHTCFKNISEHQKLIDFTGRIQQQEVVHNV